MPETVNSGTGMPDAQGRHDEIHPAPGTERPRRYRPRLRYELIGCGLHGHELLGTDAAALRAEDSVCSLRDRRVALVPVPALRLVGGAQPARPAGPAVPAAAEEITLPLRGRPLRDRYVLRLIAVDRLAHFLVLSADSRQAAATRKVVEK